MKTRLIALGTLLALSVSAVTAIAHVTEYKIDPGHTLVGFNVRHFFTKVPGRFKDFSGTIAFDDHNVANSQVDVIIQSTSVNTENERRDTHLRGGDFFMADSFPTITFKSTKVVPGPDNAALVHGDLTIRGITKPVILDARFIGVMDDSRMGRKIAGFEGRTTINRKDFGIVWNRTFDQGAVMLGDDVAIELNVEAVWRDPNAPPPPQRPPQAQPDKK